MTTNTTQTLRIVHDENDYRFQQFACPLCESTRFKYLEDITCAREVNCVADGGKMLLIDGYYDTNGFDEEGENIRLMCCDCCAEYPIPEGLELEFV